MGKDLRGELGKERKGADAADQNVQNQAEDLMKKYGNKSESELMSELFKRVERGKADGTFNESELYNFVQNVSPMLNSEQKQKLSSILETLKNKRR